MVLLFRCIMMLSTFATVDLLLNSENSPKFNEQKDSFSMNKTPPEAAKDNYVHQDNLGLQRDSVEENFEKPRPRDSMKYQHLCATVSNTVHLNTRHEEFNPPFYVEKRCKQGLNSESGSSVQKCGFDLLHCVQTFTTRHLSRRKAGTHCWEPFSIEVPSGCECMWPIDEFGPLQRKEEL